MGDKLEATGLRKKCPRCRAIGEVFINQTLSDVVLDQIRFNINWPDSVDTNVSIHDLFEVEFGCGYDD